MLRLPLAGRAALLLALTLLWACSDSSDVTGIDPQPGPTAERLGDPPPAPLVVVSWGGDDHQIWAYTDNNLDGVPSDPINLVFAGQGDARNVRAALLSLDGSRAGPFAPFTCAWTDAIGGMQAAYATTTGWTGSVIQLECGSYTSVRFHLRLFPINGAALANAHLDVLIPGTHDHQVLTWELAEQLVVYDLIRSGLLAANPASTGPINAAPTFREIPPVIYNELPPQLRSLTGGPLAGDVSSGVGIQTDGSATILTLTEAPPAGGTSQTLELTYGQRIPKPFCNPSGEFIRVDGPITLRSDVRISPAGVLSSQTSAAAELTVRSVDPGTGGLSEPFGARVRDHSQTHMNDHAHWLRNTRQQQLNTLRSPQRLMEELRVGHGGPARFRSDENCG